MSQNVFTQRVFKGTCALKDYLRSTQRALGHSGIQAPKTLGDLDPWALDTLGHSKGFWTLRHSRTWALGQLETPALGRSRGTPRALQKHLGTLTLQMYLGTEALRYLDTRGTWGFLFGRYICWLGSQSCLFYFEYSCACLKDYQKSFSLTFCATLLSLTHFMLLVFLYTLKT